MTDSPNQSPTGRSIIPRQHTPNILAAYTTPLLSARRRPTMTGSPASPSPRACRQPVDDLSRGAWLPGPPSSPFCSISFSGDGKRLRDLANDGHEGAYPPPSCRLLVSDRKHSSQNDFINAAGTESLGGEELNPANDECSATNKIMLRLMLRLLLNCLVH